MTITLYNARISLRMNSGDFFIWDEVTHLIIDDDTVKIKMRNKRESGKFPVSLIRNCEIYY